MFRHYLKIALRNIRKYALQNLVSVIGLAAGFVVFAFSSLWTGYASSYDSYHKDADRIYTFAFNEDGRTTVGNERTRGNGDAFYMLFRDFADAGKLDMLGIESILYYDIESGENYVTKVKDPVCLCIDSAFIDFFNPVLLAGDWSFLDDLGKIAVSKSYASRNFGDENPLGKEIKQGRNTFTVSAIIDDFEHSFIYFELMKKWNGYSSFNYKWLFFKLQEGVTVQDMLDKCNVVMQEESHESVDNAMRYKRIVPLKEVYRNLNEADQDSFVRFDGLDLISKASLLILLCAIVNHFTFFLNYLRGRRRDITLRKVNGASNGNIAMQMTIESCIPVLISLLVGIIAFVVLKDPFMRLADIGMTDSFYWGGCIAIMAAVLGISILAGIAEVMIVGRNTLKDGTGRKGNDTFGWVSTGIQIVSGMTLMFAMFVILHQFNYMRNINWGTLRKDMAIVNFPQKLPEKEEFPNGMFRYVGERPMWGDEYLDILEDTYGLKDRISSIPCVKGVYLNFADISISHYGHSALTFAKKVLDRDCLFPDVYDYICPELTDRLGLTVLEGAIPAEGIRDDEVVITKNMLTALGAESMEEQPYVYIKLSNDSIGLTPFKVVAIVNDIHLKNYDDIPPHIILCSFRNKYLISEWSYGRERDSGTRVGELSVSLQPGSKKEFESSLKELMDGLGIEYELKYADGRFFKHLSKDRNLTKIILILCLFSMATALFGVYSQIALTCDRRRREIAIRKAHGAKIRDIMTIFVREYGTVFVISSVLAFVLGYMVMHHWLQQFYYQATVSWWIYLAVFAFTALVIAATVTRRILKTARENPYEVIKNE